MTGFEIPTRARKPRTDQFGRTITPTPPLASNDPVNELLVDCKTCNAAVLVCGFVDDLDPAAYVCLDCRPVKQDPRALELADAVKRAREQTTVAAKTGDPIPH